MRTFFIIIATLAFTTGCESNARPEPELPELNVYVDIFMPEDEATNSPHGVPDNTVDTGDTEEPEPITATLQIAFTTALSGWGDASMSRNSQNINFGGFQFTASEPMWIDTFNVQTYATPGPGLFEYFTPNGRSGAFFSDHLGDCVLKDSLLGTVYAGPVDVDPTTGLIAFEDAFYVNPTEGAPILNVYCDHNGYWPSGELDAFAIDLATTSDVTAQTDSGNDLDITFANYNGGGAPSLSYILSAAPWCDFETPLADGSAKTLHARVVITRSDSSPAGTGFTPEYQEVARFDVANLDDCASAYTEGFNLWIGASDNAGTGWTTNIPFDIVDLTTGLQMYSGSASANQSIPVRFNAMSYIDPLATHTYVVYADVGSASSLDDDSLQVQIEANTLDLNDTASYAPDVISDRVDGGIIVF